MPGAVQVTNMPGAVGAGAFANAASKPFLDDLGQQLVAALPENPQGAIFDQLDGLAGGAEDDPATGEPSTVEGVIENSQ